MNFNDLMAKMRELDQPAVESTPVLDDAPVAECPPDMPPSPMSPTMSKPDTPPPSMSLNLNAQGLDNIEELMKLIKAVNPDADKPMGGMPPSISIEPMDKPMGGLPPLKMLPDLSDEPEGDHPEPDADNMGGPSDNDADNMPDGAPKKDKEEAFGNSLGDSEPETMGINAAIPDGDDLNKPKKSFSDKPFRGDNPMAAESTDLRSQIRAELLRRLEEAKGVK